MSSADMQGASIEQPPAGLTLVELLARHPQVARRTAQRRLSQMTAARRITARGEGRHAVIPCGGSIETCGTGRIRQHAVDIGTSAYRPLSVPQKIENLFDVMLAKTREIADPFEQSFFVMVHLPYLQPFADINKRTARYGLRPSEYAARQKIHGGNLLE